LLISSPFWSISEKWSLMGTEQQQQRQISRSERLPAMHEKVSLVLHVWWRSSACFSSSTIVSCCSAPSTGFMITLRDKHELSFSNGQARHRTQVQAALAQASARTHPRMYRNSSRSVAIWPPCSLRTYPAKRESARISSRPQKKAKQSAPFFRNSCASGVNFFSSSVSVLSATFCVRDS
jgi:hypothetical protein